MGCARVQQQKPRLALRQAGLGDGMKQDEFRVQRPEQELNL